MQMRDGQYHWAFHVKCAQELYESYQESEYWEVAREPPAGVTLNVVRAAKSDRLVEVLNLEQRSVCICSGNQGGNVTENVIKGGGPRRLWPAAGGRISNGAF